MMKKKYAEILLCYRWLFIKGNVFIGELGIFGADSFLCYSQYFVKANFIIGRVECMHIHPPYIFLKDMPYKCSLVGGHICF